MLLHRLVSWAGRENIFHSSHYGFMPFKDCAAALCQFYEDISTARNSRKTVLVACLDIRAAYDSIWIDGLIYKLASIGIRGKIGRWIANFLTDRSICVRWKNVFSDFNPCRKGVPQGSVISPFLFMVFMANIFEILGAGVHLLLYADDIIIYAIGDDPARTLSNFQNCLDRLVQWCEAHHLSVSPDKSLAIDFSRRRNADLVVTLMGQELEWQPVVKILGVWFGKSLLFNHHFSYLRSKAFKRLNILKFVTSLSRGVHSIHMMRMVNSTIRSLLEYACPLFLKACPSTLQSLEVVYNAALRVATGLPKCTPIPLLRREAQASSMGSRFRCLTYKFLIRQLSLPSPPFSVCSQGISGNMSLHVGEFLSLYNIHPESILKFTWPPPSHCFPEYQIVIDGLPFQIPFLPLGAVFQAWSAWKASLSSVIILASDASKDESKTAIGVYNDTERSGFAVLVPHLNSVFTAEGLALYTALTTYVQPGGHYFICTDSLSVLRALCNVSLRSPRVILLIHNCIYQLLQSSDISITLVWCPGHKGIPPNEIADSYARNGPYLTAPLNWVAPEDIVSLISREWETEKLYAWLNSDYSSDFPHLTEDQNFRSWTSNRQEDVWLTRWRTRMWMTNSRLYRMRLSQTPLCLQCGVTETPDHLVLHCRKFRDARACLFLALGLGSNPTYSDVMSCAMRSRSGVRALLHFSSLVANL